MQEIHPHKTMYSQSDSTTSFVVDPVDMESATAIRRLMDQGGIPISNPGSQLKDEAMCRARRCEPEILGSQSTRNHNQPIK